MPIAAILTGLASAEDFEDSDFLRSTLRQPFQPMIPLVRHLDQLPANLRAAAAVGNFDGVHRGHGALIRQLVQLADDLGGPAVVITFDPPPIAVLHPQLPLHPPLTTLERRAELLGGLGVQGLLALPTSADLLNLSPEQFVDQILVGRLRVRGLVEGPNFRFGKDRAGDVSLLQSLCQQRDIQLRVVQAEAAARGMISRSRIRQRLADGQIASANRMLTQPFQLQGTVAGGAGRGQRLLVPTANLTQVQTLVPAQGVYAGSAKVEGQSLRAAINIGPNPTFGEQQAKIEVHLLDWQGDLYGRTLHCDLIDRVRDVRKFESTDELLRQIRADIAQVVQAVPLAP